MISQRRIHATPAAFEASILNSTRSIGSWNIVAACCLLYRSAVHVIEGFTFSKNVSCFFKSFEKFLCP